VFIWKAVGQESKGPNMDDKDKSVLQHVPQWFISAFAVTYLTGFLIDSLYYSSIGITDVGEVLKLRHVQLGLLFLMLFLLMILPLFFFVFGAKNMAILGESNPNELPPMTPIMAGTSMLFFGTIYYVVAIVPPGYFYYLKHPIRLAGFLILIASVIGSYIFLTHVLMRRTRKAEQDSTPMGEVGDSNKKFQTYFLRLIFVYILIWDCWLFRELIPEFLNSLWPYGIFFFAFCIIFTALLSRLFRRLEQDSERLTPFAKIGFISIGMIGLIIVYYATVAAFAYTIFPYIPSTRGGAKYTDAQAISIVVDEGHLIKNPAFVPTDSRLDNLVLLYSTANSFYFGVCGWRRTEEIKSKGPSAILEVKRAEIKYLVVSSVTAAAKIPDCPSSDALKAQL
jgi:hypothetical protein